MLIDIAAPTDTSFSVFSKPIAAIYGRPVVAKNPSMPSFGRAGTGGFEGAVYIKLHHGYPRFQIVDAEAIIPDVSYAPYADLMEEVKTGFGRTMSHLPIVFGVSRQTIYNWLSGEVPKEQHRAKLVQLAAAAQVFIADGFKPTPIMLDRTVAQGKSLIDLIKDGADGREMAQKLIRIVHRGTTAREKLDEVLGGRGKQHLSVSDMGRPSLKEDA